VGTGCVVGEDEKKSAARGGRTADPRGKEGDVDVEVAAGCASGAGAEWTGGGKLSFIFWRAHKRKSKKCNFSKEPIYPRENSTHSLTRASDAATWRPYAV
jgi:hypothetical protein